MRHFVEIRQSDLIGKLWEEIVSECIRPEDDANDLQVQSAFWTRKGEHDFLVEALNETAIVAVTDVKGRILFANDKFCEISGYAREELIGQDHRILKSEVHTTDEFRKIYRIIASGRTWRGEFCNRAKSGHLYWVDTTIIPRIATSGKVIGYTSIRIDITQRKTMEEILRRSELLNRSTMMALGDGIVVYNNESVITSFNPAAERILRLVYDPDTGSQRIDPAWTVIGESGRELTAHELPERVALETGQPQQGILIGLKKPGEADVWLAVNSVPMMGPAGEVESVVISITDITERLAFKQMLAEATAAIPDGVTIFDQNGRLVAFNEAYRQTYAAMAPAIKLGVTFAELMAYGIEHGQFPEAGVSTDDHSAWLTKRLAQHANPSSDIVRRLPNGRWIQIRERHTPSGYIVGCRTDITDVKQEALRLRTVIDNFPGAISLLDAELNLVAYNDAFRTLLDLPAELFEAGLPTLEAIFRSTVKRGEYGPGDVERQVCELLELVRRNKPHVFQQVRANGVVLEIQGIPIPDGGLIVTYIDITERHLAEQRLARSEQYATKQSETLKMTLAHMSQGLTMFNERDLLLVWNDRFREIYRVPADLLQTGTSSRALSDHLISIGFIETSERRWRDKIRAGESFSARITNRDGRVIKVVYTPVPDSGWVATHEDITERIQSQAQFARQSALLTQSYVQLDAALTSMSQGLVLLNAQGNIALTNSRFRDMYGLKMEDLLPGRPVREIVEYFAQKYSKQDFSVDQFIASIPKETSRILHLNDGRIIQINRSPTPDGGWVATHEDITDRERAAKEIAHLAFHDCLTGLSNRTEFHRLGEEAVKGGGSLSVILVDLDHFKSVNDTLGHAAGDQLLKMVASRMRAIVRPVDAVARLGGDEFAILQGPAEDQRDAATSLATRLTEVLTQPYWLEGKRTVIGVSVGAAIKTATVGSMDHLVQRADLALYEVKSLGRNSCKLYDDELGARAEERFELENDLCTAVYGSQLELHYQPIVSMIDRAVCGFEALIRWRHPKRGLLLPDRFIPLAEESGLIVPLSEFVVRQACADAANWPSHIRVAVNISPTHLLRKGLLDTVVDALLQNNLVADRLEIEVTETVLMKNDDEMLLELHQLQNLGVRVALDDFGTGYSSMSHLRAFSFDKIKIDRSFVSEMAERANSAAIVCAMAGLAQALDIQTTAEGIETEDQFQILRAAGCSQGQGFLFGKPLPFEETIQLANSSHQCADFNDDLPATYMRRQPLG
ncbi:PAS-domain containing protein [Rhodopseudomonas sp.]|uniref:PAS-domain containing protein n=1 Tax=Rhodopseudomonas sp. TaxID=1078 RepID=UPI0039E50059